MTDKTGLVEFARKLAGMGVELVSTGGTAKLLRDSGVSVKDISELTGFPEMLDGRVKTLHPKVHGGILHRRENSSHRTAVAEHGIEPIDMVVVNLYAFEKTAAKPGVPFEDVIENIDIGGPSMIRSAAKNFQDVAVVTSPADYEAIAEEMAKSGGELSRPPNGAWRKRRSPLQRHTIRLSPLRSNGSAPTAISNSIPKRHFRTRCAFVPQKSWICVTARIRTRKLRCIPMVGRRRRQRPADPGQRAFLQQHCRSASGVGPGAGVRGTGLRHHQAHQPSGTATGETWPRLTRKALECDPVSAFGGVIGVNRTVDAEAAEEMAKLFLEVIAAPSFDEAAKAKFAAKKEPALG